MEASGQGRVFGNRLTKSLKAAGKAVVLFSAGMTVSDMYSSEHIFQKATCEVIVNVASVGGVMVGDVVGATLSTFLLGVEASPISVVAIGIIGGIVVAIELQWSVS